jgi:L-threonylcarbamoyladenylate synthase
MIERKNVQTLRCDNYPMAIISNCTASIISDAALVLKEGHLVAFPTETVYGLGADATNEKAIARIYEVKGRPKDHPLIVHISSIELMDKWASEIPDYAIKLARAFWPGPMTLILSRTNLAKDFITGGQDNVGIRIPAHTIALAILKVFEAQGGLGVAAPSANRFGKLSPTTSAAVELELGKFLSKKDKILDGGASNIGVESTIIDCTNEKPVILRPGAVSIEMIEGVLGIKLHLGLVATKITKAPGLLDNHYAPKAKVFLTGTPSPGDGYIALSDLPTPVGVIRLASPKDNIEYAHMLYESLRLGDSKCLKRIFVAPPSNQGLGLAINDRLVKAASH